MREMLRSKGRIHPARVTLVDSPSDTVVDVPRVCVGLTRRLAVPDLQRSVFPIPERAHVGLITHDAKDPATSFPPIEPLRPRAGAPDVLVTMQ